MPDLALVVLAAGKGTRMMSDLPKVMHQAAGRSLLGHVLTTAAALAPARLVVVTGPDMPEVAEEARKYCKDATIVVQAERKGTAHAVAMAAPYLADFKGRILVVYGDVPLIEAATLRALTEAVKGAQPLAVLGFRAADPTGYGRLIVTREGTFTGIKEELDATPEERAITLCNSGVMAADAALLWKLLPRIGNNNAKGEFYLTDLPGLAAAEGFELAYPECPDDQVLGVNTRAQLAAIEAALQHRLRHAAMAQRRNPGRTRDGVPVGRYRSLARMSSSNRMWCSQPASRSATGRKSAASAISSGPPSARRRWSVRLPGYARAQPWRAMFISAISSRSRRR